MVDIALLEQVKQKAKHLDRGGKEKLVRAMIEKGKRSFRHYAEYFLKIRTKTGAITPLVFNKAQLHIDTAVESQRQAGKPVRVVILKSRQQGASTYSEGRIFYDTTENTNTRSLIVAHDVDSSDNLFDMSKLYYDELPKVFKPETRRSNRKEILFDGQRGRKGLRSKITIDTANNPNLGRSYTYNNVHISELAFWQEPEKSMGGLLQAVPSQANTMIIVESTANGVGGYFYDMFWRAWRRESEFIAIFIPWFWDTGYAKDLTNQEERAWKLYTGGTSHHMSLKEARVILGFTSDNQHSEEEEALIKKFNLDFRQIKWRRWAVSTLCNGDIQLYRQEYPATPEEAFQSSGRNVFNPEVLAQRLLECSDPKLTGDLVLDEQRKPKFSPNPKGFIKVWKEPDPKKTYLISADVAEGLEHGDFSCADVICVQDMEQVAQWHGHIDPDLFGVELCKLGNWYNQAILVPESNNHGLATIKRIQHERYRHLHVTRHENKITRDVKEKFGWETNTKTKPIAIDRLNEVIREGTYIINCRETIQECMTYVKDARGKMGALKGKGIYDDRVVSSAIGVFIWIDLPKTIKEKPQRVFPSVQDQVWSRIEKRKQKKPPSIPYIGEI